MHEWRASAVKKEIRPAGAPRPSSVAARSGFAWVSRLPRLCLFVSKAKLTQVQVQVSCNERARRADEGGLASHVDRRPCLHDSHLGSAREEIKGHHEGKLRDMRCFLSETDNQQGNGFGMVGWMELDRSNPSIGSEYPFFFVPLAPATPLAPVNGCAHGVNASDL